MTSATYQRRKAAGACMGNATCAFPPVPGRSMCADHAARASQASSRWQSANRLRLKLAGLCQYSGGCGQPVTEDPPSPWCREHRTKVNAITRRSRSTRAAKRRATKYLRELRRARAANEQCPRCGVESPGGWCAKCRAHKKRHWEAYKQRHGIVTKRVEKCGHCREMGHRITTCPRRGELELKIDNFATRRLSVD